MTFHYVINEIENRTLIVSPMQRKKDLRQAIERDEFKVYYQPIVSLSDRKIIAVEALLRWQHPQNGLVSAKEFIPAAEKTGLIDTIGEWMLQVACTQIKVWQEAGVPLKLAINLSERQLERGPDRIIARALQSTGLDPTALQVEVPATSAFENRAMILPNLQALKKLGIQISVDNYSGNFPLSSLSQFPFNTIKIDRAMLEKVNNPQDAETIHGMISSALSQGLNVIAEGVETEEQLNFLRTQLCTQAQGYLLGRPAPAEELTLLFQDREISSASGLAKRRSRSKVVGL
jgi:EAL domain-containing protein (putative c-di-GMP-specific phosphodiesterase class I)